MIKRKCKECSKEFILTDSEINFYKERNLELPKRCSECRKKKKSNSNDVHNDYIKETNHVSKKKSVHNNLFKSLIAVVVVVILALTGKNIDLFNSNENNTIQNTVNYSFRNDKLLEEHFEKHKTEFDYSSKKQYVEGANNVINSKSSLHKTENEDGDDIYYDKDKNEIVFVSGDGFIRSYFKPSDGINYYNRQ